MAGTGRHLIGAHMSIAGGFPLSVERALSVDATALQVFVKSARQWKGAPLDVDDAARFRRALDDTGLAAATLAHASYLINLGTDDPALRRRSIDALRDELERCELLAIPFLVLHPGSHGGRGVEPGLLAVVSAACTGVEVPIVPDGVQVSYSEHLEPLVIARCLSCHTAEEPEARLVLEEGTGYGQMVGRTSTQVPELLIVAPGEPDASYLWRKLTHEAEIGRGMPRTVVGSIRLPEGELELYRRWIDDGALP